MRAFAMLPLQLQETLLEHGQVINIPHIGHPDNSVFPNVQMNIAFPVSEMSSGRLQSATRVQLDLKQLLTDGSMKGHLGSFGGNHTDGFDATGGYTAMTNLSMAYPDIHPGYFYMFSLGICWELVMVDLPRHTSRAMNHQWMQQDSTWSHILHLVFLRVQLLVLLGHCQEEGAKFFL
jgi:hypothetical protein